MNTKFSYTYRDADNYKAGNQVILKGTLTKKQKAEIIALMDLSDGEPKFVPSDVDLEDLQHTMKGGYGDADHPFHEFDGFEETSEKEDAEVTADELYQAFKKREGKWTGIFDY